MLQEFTPADSKSMAVWFGSIVTSITSMATDDVYPVLSYGLKQCYQGITEFDYALGDLIKIAEHWCFAMRREREPTMRF
jgi:hypothetical protein